ncbi:MAG: tetratricopeptide repeat protein [Parvicellaceae bacterium]
MKKYIIFGILSILISYNFGQKLQLTEAATEFRNNYNGSWVSIPDSTLRSIQLSKNKSILLKAKKAIDESYLKQTTTPFTKSKDETKMYYYRGAIYLDYWMLSNYDAEILKNVIAVGESEMNEATFGSFSKCLELDIKNQWKSDINNKINIYRNLSINNGVDCFQKKNYSGAFNSFKMGLEMYNVLSLTDTLAMINAALSAEKMKNTNEAYKYYKMCADVNYGNGAEMYQSMIRVLNAEEVKNEEKILNVIDEGKQRFPKDYILNIEEFNYWYSKGDNEKAQQALENAIESDPTNKVLHFNVGVTYDNISNKYHKENKHDVAFTYMNKAINGYKKAIELDDNYVDAYYNLGALYYNQSITAKSVAGDYSGEKYDKEMKSANEMLKKAIPLLEKVLSLSPSDKSTLTVLKSLYFNLDDMDNYSRIKKQLDSL